METKILEDLGLTKNEVKVSLSLLEMGQSSAGEVIRQAEVQNSVFHFNINNLIRKGLVTYLKKGKIKIYNAANPSLLVNYIEDKKKQLKQILPSLIEKQKKSTEKENAEIFEGIKGIMNVLNLLIVESKEKDEFLFFSSDETEKDEKIQKFYEMFDSKRKEKKLVTKGIAPRRLKNLFKNRKYLQMKYIDFPIPENTGMCGNKMAIISWLENPKAILITSKNIVNKQRRFFNEIWKMAKK